MTRAVVPIENVVVVTSDRADAAIANNLHYILIAAFIQPLQSIFVDVRNR